MLFRSGDIPNGILFINFNPISVIRTKKDRFGRGGIGHISTFQINDEEAHADEE